MKQYIKEYFKENLLKIGSGIAALLLFALVFYLYDIAWSIISYPLLICFIIYFTYILWDFFRYEKHSKSLDKMIAENSYDTSFLKPNLPLEKKYAELINSIQKNHSAELKQLKTKHDNIADYLLLWSHQIKTPLSALNLMSQKLPNSSEYMEQLFYVDAYIDMMLQFLKLDDINEDYMFESFNIGNVVRDALKFFRPVFINSNTSVQLDRLDVNVLSDKKLLSFVIKQLLSNAIKYTSGGTVKIYMENPHTLVVEDNGIGINAEDIPLIFKKGFTGYNGRQYQKSSGIGLFLCHDILEKINHSINITSTPSKGTVVRVGFLTKL